MHIPYLSILMLHCKSFGKQSLPANDIAMLLSDKDISTKAALPLKIINFDKFHPAFYIGIAASSRFMNNLAVTQTLKGFIGKLKRLNLKVQNV